ncbi:MAG: alpha/beta fold hydrolase [bacterium]|nr:alpha/beta fold hydrolase [bacterium]
MKEIILQTEDSEKIYANWHSSGHRNCILLCHGFMQYKDSPSFSSMAEELSVYFDVLSMDMRGHGKSSGVFTYGSKEKHDIKAAIDFMEERYERVYVMAFSLGASASLEAVLEKKTVDFMALVSPPSCFRKIFPKFWTASAFKTLMNNLGSGKKVRGLNIFHSKKYSACLFSDLKIPSLVIYSDRDWVIGKKHIQEIKKHAEANVDFIEFPGTAHAEHIFEQNPGVFLKKLLRRISKQENNNFQEVIYEQVSHKQVSMGMAEKAY